MRVRHAGEADRPGIEAFLTANNADRVARLGELVDATTLPALIAEEDGTLAGVLTYDIRDAECEVVTIHAADRQRGAGTALLRNVERIAIQAGCRRLWLTTTNDNLDALRFYQRRGMHIARVHPSSVDDARRLLKPGIPDVGAYGIPSATRSSSRHRSGDREAAGDQRA